jgi:hypothetical protein
MFTNSTRRLFVGPSSVPLLPSAWFSPGLSLQPVASPDVSITEMESATAHSNPIPKIISW